MTEAIYLEVTEKTEAAKKAGRQVSRPFQVLCKR